MALSAAQVKGKIKNIAQQNHADARVLLRLYAMDRFLERLVNSKYRDNFVIKGGILVTAMVGVSQRATMDIDASINNEQLSAKNAELIIKEIANINLNDGMTFFIKSSDEIMDEMEYPGIRILMNAYLDKMVIPLKIDISTGDVITPQAVEFDYPLILEKRTISLWSYNLETVLAEKLQTIMARGILNTRMRDYYDVYTLLNMYGERINQNVFRKAFIATCQKRKTNGLLDHANQVISSVETNESIQTLWKKYQEKYSYAAEIPFHEIIKSIVKLVDLGQENES